jgi:hypothetical protein
MVTAGLKAKCYVNFGPRLLGSAATEALACELLSRHLKKYSARRSIRFRHPLGAMAAAALTSGPTARSDPG